MGQPKSIPLCNTLNHMNVWELSGHLVSDKFYFFNSVFGNDYKCEEQQTVNCIHLSSCRWTEKELNLRDKNI